MTNDHEFSENILFAIFFVINSASENFCKYNNKPKNLNSISIFYF